MLERDFAVLFGCCYSVGYTLYDDNTKFQLYWSRWHISQLSNILSRTVHMEERICGLTAPHVCGSWNNVMSSIVHFWMMQFVCNTFLIKRLKGPPAFIMTISTFILTKYAATTGLQLVRFDDICNSTYSTWLMTIPLCADTYFLIALNHGSGKNVKHWKFQSIKNPAKIQRGA